MGLHHLLTGSYTNTSLYLLAFDTISKTLTLNSIIPGFGLHQYVTSNAARDVIYATTMSEPPRIFSWARKSNNQLLHINTANVSKSSGNGKVTKNGALTSSATSSCYISDNGKFTFSAGGSGARVNALNGDGGIGDMVSEMFYVPKEEIRAVDKTRNALYGAHGFDVNFNNKGFIPHLAWDAIFMYDILKNGTAKLLSVNLSPEVGDGPRNVYPSKDGKWLYVINEHSQYLDVYSVGNTMLTHHQRASDIPDNVRGKFTYRSNAVQLSRDGKTIFTSTRGWNNTMANGWVSAFAIGENGALASTEALTYYKAPLTLGSAAGLRVAFWNDETGNSTETVSDYMYLSDTQEGWMYILGWTPTTRRLEQVAELRYPNGAAPYEAVWLD